MDTAPRDFAAPFPCPEVRTAAVQRGARRATNEASFWNAHCEEGAPRLMDHHEPNQQPELVRGRS